MRLAETNPAIRQAYSVLRELSEDEATRKRNEAHLKFLRDQHAFELTGMRKGVESVATKMLARSHPIEEIIEVTGLTYETLLALQEKLVIE